MKPFEKQGSVISRVGRRGILQAKYGMRRRTVAWLETAREVAAVEVRELGKDLTIDLQERVRPGLGQ